jgi:hypothetical protein
MNTPRAAGRSLLRVAALAAIAFYAGTAHLTRGHEADFGKQWLAARLVATGQGRQLFDFNVQRAELQRHYSSAVIDSGIWREGIGGPTYPPTLAVVFAPLGWLSPSAAQWVVVELSLVAIIMTAFLIARMTAGAIPWEIGTLAALTFTPFFLAVGLGQNTAFSLLIVTAGWALLAGGRDVWAGVAWGLFAIKPTWGVAVVWIPLVLARPRAYLGMCGAAAGLAIATLPACGIDSWLSWLSVARETEHVYQTWPRWTLLSRDLPGLLRRFDQGALVEFAGWAIVVGVVGITGWAWWRGRVRWVRADSDWCVSANLTHPPYESTGPRATAVLAAIVLSCPRFMFYDLTLAVLPALVALSGWKRLAPCSRTLLAAAVATIWCGACSSYLLWSMMGPPVETLGVLGLWAWAVAESAATTQLAQRAEPLTQWTADRPEMVAAAV